MRKKTVRIGLNISSSSAGKTSNVLRSFTKRLDKVIFRRFQVVVIGLILTLNILSTSVLAATNEQMYAGNQLRTLGLMKGYGNGTLQLDNNITRAQVAALLVRTLGYSDSVVIGEEKNFSDVPDFWATQDIQKAYKLKLIVGDPGGTFRPFDNISYAEVVAIMVNALGKNQNLVGDWPTNYINKAIEIGIIPEDVNVNTSKKVTRGEVSVILWDTILVKR